MTPLFEIEIGTIVENLDQIGPGRIPELKLLQVDAQAVLKLLWTENAFKLPHHDRRLLINDGSVKTAGFIEIGQFLTDRMRSTGPIHSVCDRIIRDEESQIMVHAWI